MRGTILLSDSVGSRGPYADHFRANELYVCEAANQAEALKQLSASPPDAIVVIVDEAGHGAPLVSELRAGVDDAVSILVISADVSLDSLEQFHAAGADLLLANPIQPSEVLYEVRRALILRRSGRRLPWNWPEQSRRVSAWW